MKKSIFFFASTALLLSACNKSFEKTESGVEYKILSHDENARGIKPGDMLLVNLKLTTETTDSVIMETFKDNNPRYIPAEEPTLKEVLALLSMGDSAEFIVNADTLFQKSFGVPKPASMKDEKNVHFIFKVVEVFNQKELEKKTMEQVQQLKDKDSMALAAYVAKEQNVQKTASGMMYIVEKAGAGKKAEKGAKVSMRYKGYFMNGEVFDEKQAPDEFTFTLGLGQVIPGWDEAVSMMTEGSKYKLIIPWKLAYGERGSGPILPCTSLIFDVELLKVN